MDKALIEAEIKIAKQTLNDLTVVANFHKRNRSKISSESVIVAVYRLTKEGSLDFIVGDSSDE